MSFNIKRAKVGKRTSVQADFFKNAHGITMNVGMMMPDIHEVYSRLKAFILHRNRTSGNLWNML